MITPDEIDKTLLSQAKIFHFGSVSMTTEPARGTTLYAVKSAKKNGALISYDPNLRELLWGSLSDAREVMLDAMRYCDIVKVSEEELNFLTGMDHIDSAMLKLMKQYNTLKLLVVTMGSRGCKATCGQNILPEAGFNVKTIDTVGAGDTFWGAFLYQVISKHLNIIYPNEKLLSEALRFSNAAGALSTIKHGAIHAMPALDDILNLTKQCTG
jgi:fructokinase